MSDETKTIETKSVETTTGAPESSINLFGSAVSFRGILALSLVLTLCALAIMHPELYKEVFSGIAMLAIGFYFGQAAKK